MCIRDSYNTVTVHKVCGINTIDLFYEASKVNNFLHLYIGSKNEDKDLSQIRMNIFEYFNSLEENSISVLN